MIKRKKTNLEIKNTTFANTNHLSRIILTVKKPTIMTTIAERCCISRDKCKNGLKFLVKNKLIKSEKRDSVRYYYK
jgi:response regulator of citrate/malate metabolism